MEPLRIVVDTSIFTNPDSSLHWGEDRATAFARFVAVARALGDRVRFAMPPSILDELREFLGGELPPSEFEVVVEIRSPDRYGQNVPGLLLYDLIDDLRGRIDKGLRVAEKHVREAHPDLVEDAIRSLRNEYRAALRAGLLDSVEDVDLILLARELDAALVSSDKAVQGWADKLSIRLIHPDQLRTSLERYLDEDAFDYRP